MTAELVVVSWNLQGRDPGRIRLADAIAAWAPDVLLLQEADGELIRAGLPPGYPTCLWWPDVGTRPGAAIVSRLAHGGAGTARLAGSRRRRIAWAQLMLDGGRITAASVHLEAPPWPGTPRRRRAQRAATAAWAAERTAAGERLVVGGDFNTIEPTVDGLTDVSTAGQATWRPLTVSWMRPVLRIDAIFVGVGIDPLAAKVDDRWRGSDHCPVVARMGFGRSP